MGDLLEAAGGFEPPNNGFANRRLRPLGYAASFRLAMSLQLIAPDCNKIPHITYYPNKDEIFRKIEEIYVNILSCGAS